MPTVDQDKAKDEEIRPLCQNADWLWSFEIGVLPEAWKMEFMMAVNTSIGEGSIVARRAR